MQLKRAKSLQKTRCYKAKRYLFFYQYFHALLKLAKQIFLMWLVDLPCLGVPLRPSSSWNPYYFFRHCFGMILFWNLFLKLFYFGINTTLNSRLENTSLWQSPCLSLAWNLNIRSKNTGVQAKLNMRGLQSLPAKPYKVKAIRQKPEQTS